MLKKLGIQLAQAKNGAKREEFLLESEEVRKFLEKVPISLNEEEKCVVAQVVSIGQAQIFGTFSNLEKFKALLEKLVMLDRFYQEIGGIVGYQVKISELLEKKEEKQDAIYHSPPFIDITKEAEEPTCWGIETLGELAEIYPLGGAADRLHLIDELTGIELPAAKLAFGGKMLLERLIADLQAREFLYFKKTGRQLVTPIAIMTSHEKNNHAHVLAIFEEKKWFGRPKDSIRFFTQPLVPAVNAKGEWCLLGEMAPMLKPGGHGAIWKLARDYGIFDWLKSLGRKKALVRQINNPIAGLDHGLLAFTGIGCKRDMHFGFASAPRLLKAAEGVNVLIERGSELVVSNIEYCDFAKFGIEDQPLKEGEPYSRFSSNTNILFLDLDAVAKAVEVMPFPGLLVNLKKTSYRTEEGKRKEEVIARLESTMQNIADVFVEEKKGLLATEKTFVTYNHRHKTISSAKRAFIPGGILQETPENCFYDLLFAHRELLTSCGFTLPERRTIEEYLAKGPEFCFLYHPALGPLYSLIQEKLQKGHLGAGSELLLEIADFQAKNLRVEGSLQIVAESIMGREERGALQYSNQVGKCILDNVTIENKGVHWPSSVPFWKMALKREETVKIILKGTGQFHAKNVYLKGSHTFIVEDGEILTL